MQASSTMQRAFVSVARAKMSLRKLPGIASHPRQIITYLCLNAQLAVFAYGPVQTGEETTAQAGKEGVYDIVVGFLWLKQAGDFVESTFTAAMPLRLVCANLDL